MSRPQLNLPKYGGMLGSSRADMLSNYDNNSFQGLGQVNMLRMDGAFNNSSNNLSNEDHESWANSNLFKIKGIDTSMNRRPVQRRDFQIDLNQYEAFKNQQPTTNFERGSTAINKSPIKSPSPVSKNFVSVDKMKMDSLLKVLNNSNTSSHYDHKIGDHFKNNDHLLHMNMKDIDTDFRNLNSGKDKRFEVEKPVWESRHSSLRDISVHYLQSNLVDFTSGQLQATNKEAVKANDTYANATRFHPETYPSNNMQVSGLRYAKQGPNLEKTPLQSINYGQVRFSN